jgi:hypothetical protein
MALKNQDIRKPIEDYLRANGYTFQVDITRSPDSNVYDIELMIFTVTDAVVPTNPEIKLFFRDSYTYENRENGNVDFSITGQQTERWNFSKDKDIDTIQDAIDYVSTRCRPIAARRAEVLDEEIRRAQKEKKDLERVAKEEKKDLQRVAKQISSSDIEAFVNMLLSSHNLSDFLSQTVDRLQQQYGDSKEAHKAALALIKDKLCFMVVRTYSPVIRGLDRA